ncbi:MAG: WD40 repeat domain-containing protein [Thermoguttaceae bacterium]|jgi:WD40 repeat protein
MLRRRSIIHLFFFITLASFFITEGALAQSIPDITKLAEYTFGPKDSSYSALSVSAPQDKAARYPVISALTYSNDKESFYVGGDDQKFYVCKIDDNRFEPVVKSGNADPVDDWVRAVAMRPVNKSENAESYSEDAETQELATLSQKGQIRIWDPQTGRLLRELPANKTNVAGAHAMVYSPNGALLAVCGYAGLIRIFVADTLKEYTTWTGPSESVTTLAFSPDGTALAAGGRNAFCVWRTNDAKLLIPSRPLTNGKGDRTAQRRIRVVCFSPNNQLVAVAGDADRIIVLDVASGKEVAQFDLTERVNTSVGEQALPSRKIFAMAFLDNSTLITGDSVNDVIVWDMNTLKPIGYGQGYAKSDRRESLETGGHSGTVSVIAVDRAKREFLSGSFDAKVIRWKAP